MKLAPWNVTRNFINAIQNNALLQLHGIGDPTGRGEGFSFLKSSIKQNFRRDGDGAASGKISVTEQRQAYREEVIKQDNEKIFLD